MEVPGKQQPKKTLSVSQGSAEDFLLFCIPCDRDGVRVPAKGYCSTCKEHLCDTCYKHHKKQTPSRHHILLDQDSMPTTPSVPIVKDEFDSCDDHEDEKLKFYCKDHDIVVCSVCVTLNHRLCNVEYIPKLSKHILDSEELNEIMAEMKALEDNYKSQIKRVKDEMKAISKNHDDVIKAIHQFRKEINTRLDKMEKHVFKEADNILLKQQTKLNDLSTGVHEITDKLTEKRNQLDNLIQRKCLDKLFVEMKETKKRVEEMRMKQKQYSRVDVFQTVSFVKNSDIVDMLDRHKQLGELITMKTSMVENVPVMKPTSTPSEDKTLNLEVVEDIDMNSSSKSTKCDITGIEVIKPDKIVICDNSKNVKCYDTVQKKVVSEITLTDRPFDVTAITDDKFVVTVPVDRSIYFMSLRNQRLVSDRKMNINKECYGIAYSQDKLVVTCNCNPGKVLVLDLQGKILQNFGGDYSLFSLPMYASVNTAGTSIYVSDTGSTVMAVKQLDWQGNVLNTYKPAQGGTNLQGICELNDGTFLVCLDQDSDDNLRRVSDSCKPCKIMINGKLGSWFPEAVAYCKKSRRLYVSCSETGLYVTKYLIKIFKVDWC
ncbi:uncharacterized protein LOC132725439 isoform X1 [Ruditapes philippinarum]|uniref:uncharacterized protein LOC132725439 isoform X1 n=1 Tax=Ruditapes philippinarum TaxID=129788 RepID=UPI00295BF707|nr:uncharacterized protein LOC132725439 isoform X1 [Ruditapes philippinarum]